MAKARLAYLVKPKRVDGVEGEAIVELREHELPTPGEGEILVKVEGCGICGTDVHEYRYDPFGMAPVVLGHELPRNLSNNAFESNRLYRLPNVIDSFLSS